MFNKIFVKILFSDFSREKKWTKRFFSMSFGFFPCHTSHHSDFYLFAKIDVIRTFFCSKNCDKWQKNMVLLKSNFFIDRFWLDIFHRFFSVVINDSLFLWMTIRTPAKKKFINSSFKVFTIFFQWNCIANPF